MRDYNSMLFLKKAQEMFLVSTKLYSWQMDGQFNLIETNHPDGQLLYDLFEISNCKMFVEKHFSKSDKPIIIADSIGVTWIIAGYKEKDSILEYYFLGPYFTVEASERYIMNLCRQLNISDQLAMQMQRQLKRIPTISVMSSLSYAVMLQYYAIGDKISPEVVTYVNTIVPMPEKDLPWVPSEKHNTWEAEKNLFESIKNGTLDLESMTLTNSFSGGTIGTLCPGNPLRQAKDEVIVLIILASRAAILGGVSPEGGYSIADYYVQRVEVCDTVGNIQNCAFEFLQTIMQRVRMCKERSDESSVIYGCKEYVETHLFEKINLEKMANELGYASYYLSKKFKKETGISVNDYIKEEKIKRSKALLASHVLTVNEISERLAFSSPSYFCAVFKKYTGMLPSDYQNMSQSERNKL